jgi:hypothetical protein
MDDGALRRIVDERLRELGLAVTLRIRALGLRLAQLRLICAFELMVACRVAKQIVNGRRALLVAGQHVLRSSIDCCEQDRVRP